MRSGSGSSNGKPHSEFSRSCTVPFSFLFATCREKAVETDGDADIYRGRNGVTRTTRYAAVCAAWNEGNSRGSARDGRKSFIECGRSAFGAAKRNYLRSVGRDTRVRVHPSQGRRLGGITPKAYY